MAKASRDKEKARVVWGGYLGSDSVYARGRMQWIGNDRSARGGHTEETNTHRGRGEEHRPQRAQARAGQRWISKSGERVPADRCQQVLAEVRRRSAAVMERNSPPIPHRGPNRRAIVAGAKAIDLDAHRHSEIAKTEIRGDAPCNDRPQRPWSSKRRDMTDAGEGWQSTLPIRGYFSGDIVRGISRAMEGFGRSSGARRARCQGLAPVALLLTKAPPPPVRVSTCTVKG